VAQAVPANEIRDIIIGAVLVSLIAGLAYIIPVMGFMFAAFVPLPVMLFRIKLGRVNGSLIPAISTALIYLIYDGRGSDLVMFAGLMILGLFLCEFMERNWSIDATIVFSCGSVIVCGLAFLMIYSSLTGISIESQAKTYIQKNLEMSLALYEQMDMPRDTIDLITRSAAQIQYVLIRLTPAMVIMSMLFVAWINMLTSRSVFKRFSVPFPEYGPLNRWKAPEQLVWIAISSGLMLLVPSPALKLIGLNIFLILLTVYMFQGVAIASYFFDKKRFPRWARIVLYTVIFLQQFALIVVIGLGFFDLWLDFRKLKQEEQPG
jgi:uncharacterized protein YybS (DUF2232 family)